MYIGRIVALGATPSGKATVCYRVSSRSFANRQAVAIAGGAAIVPRPGHEADVLASPYISYTGLRTTHHHAVVSNGTHTDIIANKLSDGLNMRDALSQTLIAMDFEHDDHDTPRIAAIVEPASNRGYLGVITRDALHVRPFTLEPGRLWFVATYELCEPSLERVTDGFDATNAQMACRFILEGGVFADFSNPVSAAAAMWRDQRWETATSNIA